MDQLPPDSHWASASHTLPPEPPPGPKQPATPTLASTNAMTAMLRRTRAPRLGFAGGFPGAEGQTVMPGNPATVWAGSATRNSLAATGHVQIDVAPLFRRDCDGNFAK